MPVRHPAPRLSFSCVKKKDGGERKSLMVPFRRGEAHSLPRGNPCVAAGFGPLQEKQNLLTPASPQVRPLITMRQPVLLATSPASRLRNHTHRKVGRPTLQGLHCMRSIKRQGWTLCLCRSRRLRPPSPYGIRRKDATGCWVWARWSAVLRASDARPYKAATQDSHGGCEPPFSMDRAPRRKAGRPC